MASIEANKTNFFGRWGSVFKSHISANVFILLAILCDFCVALLLHLFLELGAQVKLMYDGYLMLQLRFDVIMSTNEQLLSYTMRRFMFDGLKQKV